MNAAEFGDKAGKFWNHLRKSGVKLPDNPEAYTRTGIGAKVRRYAGKVQFIRDAVAMYYCAIDGKTPAAARALAFAALAYFVMPVDLVPDAIPGVGMLDDATVIGLAMAALQYVLSDEHREKAARLLTRITGAVS